MESLAISRPVVLGGESGGDESEGDDGDDGELEDGGVEELEEEALAVADSLAFSAATLALC